MPRRRPCPRARCLAGGGTPPWNPAPATSSGNGCLKACLIVGAILVVLFFIAVAGLVFLGNQIIKSVPVDEQGNLQACPFVSDDQLSSVLGAGTKAVPLTGLFDATIGLVLDKRVLPDAEDCWITADGADRHRPGSPATRAPTPVRSSRRRSRRRSRRPRTRATASRSRLPGYFAGDVSGVGDEAFCTDFSTALMEGVLVRKGDTLVYVSLQGTDSAESTCQQAQQVAQAILH